MLFSPVVPARFAGASTRRAKAGTQSEFSYCHPDPLRLSFSEASGSRDPERRKPGSRVPPLARLAQKGGGARDDIVFAGMTERGAQQHSLKANKSFELSP